MEDKTLLMIALAVSLIGLIVMSIFASKTEPSSSDIRTISECTVADGTKVSLKGKVESISVKGNVTKIILSQPSSIDLVAFGLPEVKAGDYIKVEGSVASYNGEREVIISKITDAK